MFPPRRVSIGPRKLEQSEALPQRTWKDFPASIALRYTPGPTWLGITSTLAKTLPCRIFAIKFVNAWEPLWLRFSQTYDSTDVLQRAGNGFDQVFLANGRRGHGGGVLGKTRTPNYLPAGLRGPVRGDGGW